MPKHERVFTLLESLEVPPEGTYHPCYAGFFECFNREDYYEAHDVLESLWLQCRDTNHFFYKGLIQIAGAFVHLKKQHARPNHPTDGRRLHPASRLLTLGIKNISPFTPFHMGLQVDVVSDVCTEWRNKIEASEFRINPWSPGAGPRLSISRDLPGA
jgi:hypothetical protein